MTQYDLALSIAGLRPGETPFLQPLVTQLGMQLLRSYPHDLCVSPIPSIRSGAGS